ncbi:MAG: UDP-glucose 4-epimerase GalE [Nitrospirota bacterium]|nr:UDP-glucose 4-epimerase GalE [Nitrospirota bacterium]
MPVLVVGGAGYIGSHVTRMLSESGHSVIVFDNLSTGFRESLLHGEQLVQGDIHDSSALNRVFEKNAIRTVLHFAASIIAPESVKLPLNYYTNNTCGTINLLKACADHNVKNLIFSSTAAVYASPPEGVVSEDSETAPLNPYGSSKLFSEQIIMDVARSNGLKYAILRYFNVAGADPKTRIGQRSPNATHLLKVCCEAALGLRSKVQIYGTDYSTPDGTGVRDYIHVEDLSRAHLLAMKYLEDRNASLTCNVGYGHGSSVRQVIESVRRISGTDFTVESSERRPGDPPSLIARSDKIKNLLQWQPQFDSLDQIVRDAFQWEKKLRGLLH